MAAIVVVVVVEEIIMVAVVAVVMVTVVIMVVAIIVALVVYVQVYVVVYVQVYVVVTFFFSWSNLYTFSLSFSYYKKEARFWYTSHKKYIFSIFDFCLK